MPECANRNSAPSPPQRNNAPRELRERFDAQRAQLAPVSRKDWWDKATPDMIERVHETATAWKASDPEVAQAAEKISEQVQSRYGIDVNNTGADEASVSAALARAQRAGAEAETERTNASAAHTDEFVAGAAIAAANRLDRADKSEPAWDTAERRQQLTESLEGKGDREAVNSRLLADKHQGTHPAGAVAQKPSGATTSRMAVKSGQDRTLQRGGLER